MIRRAGEARRFSGTETSRHRETGQVPRRRMVRRSRAGALPDRFAAGPALLSEGFSGRRGPGPSGSFRHGVPEARPWTRCTVAAGCPLRPPESRRRRPVRRVLPRGLLRRREGEARLERNAQRKARRAGKRCSPDGAKPRAPDERPKFRPDPGHRFHIDPFGTGPSDFGGRTHRRGCASERVVSSEGTARPRAMSDPPAVTSGGGRPEPHVASRRIRDFDLQVASRRTRDSDLPSKTRGVRRSAACS